MHLSIGVWLMALMACSRPPRPGPTIVWITVDTLRADHLGYAGHTSANTPNIDALAARGLSYPNATTPLPRTTPALASALTGLVPSRHGSQEVGDAIRADTSTVADAFHAAGWNTLAVSAMNVAGPEQGLDRGFDRFELHHDLEAMALVKKALYRLPDGPRFVWVHFSDPHFPYLPPNAQGPCADLGRQAESGEIRRILWFGNVEGRGTHAKDDCSRLYDEEIAHVDAAIGTLLSGIGGDPWVVFSADHGELLGEDGIYFEHGPTLHPANLNIPLIVAGPNVPKGTNPALAQLQDLVPTSLALAGLPPMPEIDGHNLLEGPPRAIASATSGSALQRLLTQVLVSGQGRRWCLNGDRYSWCQQPKGRTLHDRSTDPALSINVSATHPEVARAMSAAAQHWRPEAARQYAVFDDTYALTARPHLDGTYHTVLTLRGSDAPINTPAPSALTSALELPPSATRALRSEAELEALRALGYVE